MFTAYLNSVFFARQSITEEAQEDRTIMCFDLVPGVPVVEEPCRKASPWMLEACSGNHKAVSPYKVHLKVALSTRRTRGNFFRGQGLAFQSPVTVCISFAGALSTAS